MTGSQLLCSVSRALAAMQAAVKGNKPNTETAPYWDSLLTSLRTAPADVPQSTIVLAGGNDEMSPNQQAWVIEAAKSPEGDLKVHVRFFSPSMATSLRVTPCRMVFFFDSKKGVLTGGKIWVFHRDILCSKEGWEMDVGNPFGALLSQVNSGHFGPEFIKAIQAAQAALPARQAA